MAMAALKVFGEASSMTRVRGRNAMVIILSVVLVAIVPILIRIVWIILEGGGTLQREPAWRQARFAAQLHPTPVSERADMPAPAAPARDGFVQRLHRAHTEREVAHLRARAAWSQRAREALQSR